MRNTFCARSVTARANRYTNIGLGIFHIFLALGTAIGEITAYYMFGSIVEVVLLSLIVWIAWKWPRVPGYSAVGS
jgi:hypothetical protein